MPEKTGDGQSTGKFHTRAPSGSNKTSSVDPAALASSVDPAAAPWGDPALAPSGAASVDAASASGAHNFFSETIQGSTWSPVSKKYFFVLLVLDLLTLIFAGVATVLLWFWTKNPIVFVGMTLVAIVVFVTMLFLYRRVSAIAYVFREDDILIRKGLLFRQLSAIPYGRIQVVDTSRGPLLRMFSLVKLDIVTAARGVNSSIPGISEDTADVMRDRLISLAETRRVGL